MRTATGGAITDREVLVVGGGVAGVSLLYALSSRGVAATLIDTGLVGTRGASAIPYALLNPHRGRTGRARPLDLAGLEAFWRWRDQLESTGLDTGAHRSGVLRVASSSRQRALWSRLAGPTPLEAADFPETVRAKFGGMLVPDGGWLEPRRWLGALSQASVAAGAVIAEGVELLSLSSAGRQVAVTSGGVMTAQHVVLCLGAYDASRLRLPRLELAAGLAVTMTLPEEAHAGTGAQTSTATDEVTAARMRPLAGSIGIVFSGRQVVLSGAAHSGDDADVERLRSSAAWFVPELVTASVTSVWRGVRARRPSGVPVVRELRRGLTLFGGLGGRGFLCSALLAETLAERLAERSVIRSARQ
ncbi:MAG TPA: FAD-dependent oxidoreductase [Trueperaceae bacterium]|nr:FAD-dependent oxidoreductase [Trueperaceae bacterium]